MLLRNINPLGAVDLPLIGRTLEAGEVFEVDDGLAGYSPSEAVYDDESGELLEEGDPGEGLLAQVGNYEPAPDGAGDGDVLPVERDVDAEEPVDDAAEHVTEEPVDEAEHVPVDQADDEAGDPTLDQTGDPTGDTDDDVTDVANSWKD